MASAGVSPQRGPEVTFAKFDNGNFRLFKAHTKEIKYFAISHAWGKTSWRAIDGICGETLISEEKARFVKNNLPALVGDNAFWMDTLTVDQKNPAEVVATVQVIPDIFRDAARTIAIRESDGFYDCCEEALRGFRDWGDFHDRLTTHNEEHYSHLREESYLRRLWTFQECMLSHTIQFAVSPITADKPLPVVEDAGPRNGDAYAYRNDVEMLLDCLWVLAYSFNGTQGEDGMEGINSFIKAYATCGTVVRTRPFERTSDDTLQTIEGGQFRLVNLASNRCATMPRDYIFATMTQFPWYHYPLDAINMSFSEIFADLYKQASAAGHRFTPRIMQSMTDPDAVDNDAWRPSDDQPEPACLGDFIKLIGRKVAPSERQNGPHLQSSIHITSAVPIRQYDNESVGAVLWAIESSMNFCPQAWEEAHRGGELAKFGSFPSEDWQLDDWDAMRCGWRAKSFEDKVIMVTHTDGTNSLRIGRGLEYDELPEGVVDLLLKSGPAINRPAPEGYVTLFQQVRKIIDHMWCAVGPNRKDLAQKADWEGLKRSMTGGWSQPLLRTMLLMSAMITCGVGLSAESWCNRKFVPCFARYGDEIILSLLAKHDRVEDTTQPQMLLGVGRHTSQLDFCKELFLVNPETFAPVGLLPDFLPYRRHRTYTNELFSARARMLYPDFMIDPRPDSLKFMVMPLVREEDVDEQPRNTEPGVHEVPRNLEEAVEEATRQWTTAGESTRRREMLEVEEVNTQERVNAPKENSCCILM
ncbi:hypothetical protein AK830_g10421 [Neonectria ditissima]|uniref:Heterokaryon incompatibility domain-containing protein n=1 Tax=Neonectria ditissima TaxID=78410 RepID=A0A0P7AFV0_9HYPO|nr:hypothetical protein AK830_g10421 [Neonectria ditissima]